MKKREIMKNKMTVLLLLLSIHFGFSQKKIENSQLSDISFPIELKGNWLESDGSNLWRYSFYKDRAIVDKEIWMYKSIKKKRKKFVITLEKGTKTKIVYAKLNKDETVSFGTDKKYLRVLTTEQLKILNPKLKNELAYKESDLFKIDSATYSGVIRNYGKYSKNKTGLLHAKNVFTGNQDSYMVHIQKDGSFTSKFPLMHPQQVIVRFPGYNGSVYVEPGKETWQLINSAKKADVYFAGDCAQLNTDVVSLQFITFSSAYGNLIKEISELTIDQYKEQLDILYKKQVQKLDNEIKSRFVSIKAQQIMRLELEYQYYYEALNYDSYTNERVDKKVNAAYMSFLTPEICNNELASASMKYYFFINELLFTSPMFSNINVDQPNNVELAAILKSKGVVLTKEEKGFIEKQKNFHTKHIYTFKKQEDFYLKNKKTLGGFESKFKKLSVRASIVDRERLEDFIGVDYDAIVKLGESYNVRFSKEEIAIRKVYDSVLNKKEQQIFSAFYTKELRIQNEEFKTKYKEESFNYQSNLVLKNRLNNIKNFFRGKEVWTANILLLQVLSRGVTNQSTALNESELKFALENINNPFLTEYLVYENRLRKCKRNIKTEGSVLNETPNIEADKVFDAIISKYKSKVVFLDFWATWCGPCISGMKKMIPLKEELKDDDVVFLYITDITSPKKTYNKMTSTVKGEHYRLNKDEWNYLKIKFKIMGIPHYALINKEGKVVENKIRLHGNEAYKKAIKAHL